MAKNINDEARGVLKDFAATLKGSNAKDETEFKVVIEEFLATKALKMPKLGMPLRIFRLC